MAKTKWVKWADVKARRLDQFISQNEIKKVLKFKYRAQIKRWVWDWDATVWRITSKLTLYERYPLLHFIEHEAQILPATEFEYRERLNKITAWPLKWADWVPHPMACEILDITDFNRLYEWTVYKGIYNPVRTHRIWGQHFFNVSDLQRLKKGFKNVKT